MRDSLPRKVMDAQRRPASKSDVESNNLEVHARAPRCARFDADGMSHRLEPDAAWNLRLKSYIVRHENAAQQQQKQLGPRLQPKGPMTGQGEIWLGSAHQAESRAPAAQLQQISDAAAAAMQQTHAEAQGRQKARKCSRGCVSEWAALLSREITVAAIPFNSRALLCCCAAVLLCPARLPVEPPSR